MKKAVSDFWAWVNGNKTTIGAVSSLIVNSNYVEGLVTNPDLYTLCQGIAGLFFTIGIAHKIQKAATI